MRITGGIARNIPIKTVRGTDLRPAADRTRQSVFSSISAAVDGASVLDLFAGTGSYGLEAISRGAKHVEFVEKDHRHYKCLEGNIERILKLAPTVSYHISLKDVTTWEPRDGQHFDLIFADPPYNSLAEHLDSLMDRIRKWLKPASQSYFILEAPANFEIEFPGLRLLRHLGKGKNATQPSILIYNLEAVPE